MRVEGGEGRLERARERRDDHELDRQRRDDRREPRRLVAPALAAAVATSVLLSLQPYLLFNPDLLWQARTHGDFGFSLGVARGDTLRPWTLVDVHTVPDLH